MVQKINIGCEGKSWRFELETPSLNGKSVGDVIEGNVLKSELSGYKLKITGGSDFAGFPLFKDVEGVGLKKILLSNGWGMKDKRDGIRLRKTVRGKTIAETTTLINLNVEEKGDKKLEDVFSDQNKSPDPEPSVESEQQESIENQNSEIKTE